MFYIIEGNYIAEYKSKQEAEAHLKDIIEEGNVDLNKVKIVEGEEVWVNISKLNITKIKS